MKSLMSTEIEARAQKWCLHSITLKHECFLYLHQISIWQSNQCKLVDTLHKIQIDDHCIMIFQSQSLHHSWWHLHHKSQIDAKWLHSKCLQKHIWTANKFCITWSTLRLHGSWCAWKDCIGFAFWTRQGVYNTGVVNDTCKGQACWWNWQLDTKLRFQNTYKSTLEHQAATIINYSNLWWNLMPVQSLMSFNWDKV